MNTKFEYNQHWDDYWRNAGREDQALGGKRQQEVLKSHWVDFFKGISSGAKILDIACGSGAIFEFAPSDADPAFSFYATDQSLAAVSRASEAGSIAGVVSDASILPFAENSFDFVVSQFGIEYAGRAAFDQVARLLKPGASLNFVSHFHEGAIYEECHEQSRLLSAVVDCELFDIASRAILPTIKQKKNLSVAYTDRKIEERLGEVAREVRDLIVKAPKTTARALVSRYFNDLLRLSERRLAFEASDAELWLSGASNAINAYRDRMNSMTQAALKRDDILQLADTYVAYGIELCEPVPLIFSEKSKPGAWVLKGKFLPS